MTPNLSYTTGREGESSARIINGMENKRLYYCCCNTIPKQVAPMSDSIWTELCNWSMYNFSNHRPG